MRKVITFGSFDLFHKGHYNLLKRAKELGDYLIVGITTEKYDEYRGKLNVVDSLIERIENVRNTGLADEIIIEDHDGQKIEEILKRGIDIFVVGSDWKGKFDYLNEYCNVIYLERTKNVSSTMKRSENLGVIKLGIIGSGRIANRFVSEAKYVSGTNLEGVYNRNRNSAESFAIKHELNYFSDNLDEFLNKIDAVYIASPHNTHYEYVKKALECNKHVLCEKPFVLKVEQAIELYNIAQDRQLVLMEGIKTVYAPAFIQLISIAKSGVIGNIIDVEACFTKLVNGQTRELKKDENGGSLTELGSYPVIAIFKLLGINYNEVKFISFVDKNDIDLYTKVMFTYDSAIATAKIGLGVKSEGELIVSGTKGYIYVEAPWWKTQYFEIRDENGSIKNKFFMKFEEEGLRYELSDFIAMINGNEKKKYKLHAEESIEIVKIIENFLSNKYTEKIKIK